jgi:F-type H+-transporting ATPase subunit a
MVTEAASASEDVGAYIRHHLTFLTIGEGFFSIDIDTLAVSLVLGLAFLLIFWLAARRATAGVPGHLQNAVEWVIDFIDGQVKDAYHHSRRFVGPLALTIFIWVFFFNAMDLLPVDLLPSIAGLFGIKYFKSVPSTDLNATFGLSISVFILLIVFAIRIKGIGGFIWCFNRLNCLPNRFRWACVCSATCMPANSSLSSLPSCRRLSSL